MWNCLFNRGTEVALSESFAINLNKKTRKDQMVITLPLTQKDRADVLVHFEALGFSKAVIHIQACFISISL